ncbi:membrane assembly protein AsmA [Mesorhizobium hawassense]|uniref:Membrane assembly protein AsmA n=1 Tax=Mesorhizobium hawassense TaxID=1209954 RepID=A0A330HGI5_9HYPH|nr:AsmA family protein [Mesorhizobium hawassense]RAZ87220.1 membrane assembly protein AsmA [Mesorhizobium hawassense]
MRKIVAALTVTVVLVVGLLFLLPALVSTDWVRAELSRQLSSATGMTIRLDGPVRLSLLPKLAVVADDISLSTGTGDVAISAPRFSTSITLSSLWSKKLEIQSVALTEPTITFEASANAEPAPEPKDVQADPFAAIVDTLERLAINQLTITNGTLTSGASTGKSATVTAIDADLRVPDLDREASFLLAGTSNGRRIEMSGSLSALRPILRQLPAQITVEARLDPAPVAKFSSLRASGEIQLNGNGSYQIKGGKFDIGDQSFQMDALFQPGARHHFFADLAAKRVDIDALGDIGKGGSSAGKPQTGSGEPGLAMLAAFDADISVTIHELVGGKIRASDVQLAATLSDGQLEAKLEHFILDAGSLTAKASTNVGETPPTIRGNIASSGLDIGSLAKLAGQSVPLSGKLTADMGFAFRGLTAERIRGSVNLQGTVGIREGKLPLAALADAKDRTANDITGLNLDAKVRDIGKPVDVTGKLAWRGQAVAFKSQIAPASFLGRASVADAFGPISLSVSSKYLEGSINGVARGGGTFKGQISATSPSVDKLMQWLGQGASRNLQDFAFKGDVDAGPKQFSFQKASVALNGVKATGQGSVKLGQVLTIRTSLNFAKLDFAALAGGGGASAGGKQKPGGAADAPADLSFLEGIDARIEVAADKLGYGKVFAGPVATVLTVADGKAHLNVPQSPFYGGTIAAEMTADGSGDTASLDLNTAIAGAAAAPLLHDAADFDRIEGTLEATVAVSGSGRTTKSLARSLTGKAATKFSDGAFRGIDMAEVYNNLVGLLAGGFKQDQAKKTTFTELGASFAIVNGVAQTTDISLLGPLLRMNGSGKIDLAEQTLDMRLNPRVVASLAGQGGDVAVKGIGVPIVVQGPISAPRAYPDLSALAKDPQGALDMLGRLGLPTGKLKLDKLIPGANGDGKGAADLIGDLLQNAAPRPKAPPAAPKAAAAPASGSAEDVPPDNGSTENAPPPSSNAGSETEAEAAAPAVEPAPVDPQAAPASPEAPKKGEIDTLLDQLAN